MTMFRSVVKNALYYHLVQTHYYVEGMQSSPAMSMGSSAVGVPVTEQQKFDFDGGDLNDAELSALKEIVFDIMKYSLASADSLFPSRRCSDLNERKVNPMLATTCRRFYDLFGLRFIKQILKLENDNDIVLEYGTEALLPVYHRTSTGEQLGLDVFFNFGIFNGYGSVGRQYHLYENSKEDLVKRNNGRPHDFATHKEDTNTANFYYLRKWHIDLSRKVLGRALLPVRGMKTAYRELNSGRFEAPAEAREDSSGQRLVDHFSEVVSDMQRLVTLDLDGSQNLLPGAIAQSNLGKTFMPPSYFDLVETSFKTVPSKTHWSTTFGEPQDRVKVTDYDSIHYQHSEPGYLIWEQIEKDQLEKGSSPWLAELIGEKEWKTKMEEFGRELGLDEGEDQTQSVSEFEKSLLFKSLFSKYFRFMFVVDVLPYKTEEGAKEECCGC